MNRDQAKNNRQPIANSGLRGANSAPATADNPTVPGGSPHCWRHTKSRDPWPKGDSFAQTILVTMGHELRP